MSRVLIDTNAYPALMAGDESIADELARHDAILLSPVVIAELYDGFSRGTRNRDNRLILSRFREKPRTVCVPITDATADWYAEIKRILRSKGRPIPINAV